MRAGSGYFRWGEMMATANQLSKHTPGPWTAPSAGIWAHGVLIAGCGSAKTVRGLRKLYKLLARADVGPIIAANARLIAAAPELLKSAKEMMTALGPPVDSALRQVAAEHLQQAITKAEQV